MHDFWLMSPCVYADILDDDSRGMKCCGMRIIYILSFASQDKFDDHFSYHF